jgi:hypothetical protein
MNKTTCARVKVVKFAAAAVLAVSALPASAERPMAVDDAGTLERGGAKVEFGWSRDDEARGFDGAVGYGPIDNLEVELALERGRDSASDPDVRMRGVGVAMKWVPLQAETGLSAGLKLEAARVRADVDHGDSETARAHAVHGLASWRFAAGQAVHVNLGREWVRVDGDTEAENLWGVGVEHPLTAELTVAAEVFGAEDARPDRQIGVRYEIAEGVKLSAAIGRGNDRSFGNAGIAWEF